jgi:hypothetical protein
MPKAEITSYSVVDLLSWQESGALEVSPKFQRRSVWNTAAKSYFIDSILLDYPIPPIHIRMTPGRNNRTVREVIDGQQRIRAVFDFIANGYRISPSVSSAFGGKLYGGLTAVQSDRLKYFSFNVYQYKALSDSEVLDMFARLNTYSVQLSAQELRNGKWFGAFKQACYKLAGQSLEFWRKHSIVTEQQIARMREAEIVSELLIVSLDGMQDGKKSIDIFYENLDERWGSDPVLWTVSRARNARSQPSAYSSSSEAGQRFSSTLATIDDILNDMLKPSPFRRQALFYTLFCAFYHVLFGLPRNPDLPLRGRGFTASTSAGFRQVVGELTELFENKGRTRDPELARFYDAAARQTDNIGPRQNRLEAFLTLVMQAR